MNRRRSEDCLRKNWLLLSEIPLCENFLKYTFKSKVVLLRQSFERLRTATVTRGYREAFDAFHLCIRSSDQHLLKLCVLIFLA